MKTLRLLLFLIACFVCRPLLAQTDSCSLRISLLTCSPGEELYSTFGHSAIRVTDATRGMDIVFNFGTFEFGPDFYTEFVRGKLLYYLAVEDFSSFTEAYRYEQRSIAEQVLQLSCAEKQQLFQALQINEQPANKFYKYDFLFDNCTTRIRDLVKKQVPALQFNNILPAKPPTFRHLLYTYLDRGKQYWSKLGIDILLGSKLDKKVTNEQAMFLPDNLLKGFDSARVNNRPLVTPPQIILSMPPLENKDAWVRPEIIFVLLLLIIGALSFSHKRAIQLTLAVFDTVFFFLLGALGALLLFMWFGTDHQVCRNNFNLVWALPTHIIVAFFLHKNKPWVRQYFRITLVITLLLAISWFFIPQQLNTAVAPLLGIIALRSYFRSK